MSQPVHTILIVDDCPEDCELYRRYLLKDKTHTYIFLEAESGQTGFTLWQQHNPDIILLDYQLPDLDGLEWLTQLSSQTASPYLPVIMVTGQGSEAIAVRALKAGAQDYLVKGQITPERLQWTVQRTLISLQLQTQLQRQTKNYQQSQLQLAYHKQQEDTLRQTNQVLEHQVTARIAANMPGMLYQYLLRADGSDAFTYVSPRCRDIYELEPEELLRDFRQVWTMIHPDDVERVRQVNLASAQQLERSDTEFRLLPPSGTLRWVRAISQPEQQANGDVVWDGFVLDISDRKQAEIQLQEMSDALSNAVEGISRLDPQGRYLFVNEAYAKAVGYTPAEMIGMDWQRTVHPDDLKAVIAEYQHMLNTGKVELEARGIRKDGSILHKQLVMVSAYDDQHQFVGHHCFMKDITEKKQLEAQFLHAQRLESIGTLASGIAHDLNNILTPVLAVAQLLPRKFTSIDPTSKQLLELLEESAKRGKDLVQQVLSFARGQDEQRHILQVGYLLSEMGKIARQTFPKSIQVKHQIPTRDLWLMHANSTQLHQVLMNLCVNARDAMPEGGTLAISAENCEIDDTFAHMHLDAQVGAYVKITIADTGTGIAPEIYDRIFDPFFTTKAQGQGTGLGLATVRTIVKNHGGFLAIDTTLRQGTSFRVYLPALLPDRDIIPRSSTETALLEPLNGNGELILVVDDESAIRQTVQAVLEAHNFRVLVAQDGIDAISLYAQHQSEIDLVLLDVMMPEMDGFKLITALSGFRSPVSIIAMSGIASHQDSVLSHPQVQAFIAKPFTSDALIMTLCTVCSSNPKTRAEQAKT